MRHVGEMVKNPNIGQYCCLGIFGKANDIYSSIYLYINVFFFFLFET